MKTGVELIYAERKRQVEKEGWSAEHDDDHNSGEMAKAAAAYALHSTGERRVRDIWPEGWDWAYWKPKRAIRDLVRAGALIAAEIDRGITYLTPLG